jgi:type II secretory pathway pseudopilin PulG
MNCLNQRQSQSGYSLIELLVSMGLMLVIMGVVFTFAADSFKANTVTMEMTDAQENMRSALEAINRDLVTAGDGLNGINNIRLPRGFVTNYLAANPVLDPSNNNFVNLSIITSDNNVPTGTAVLQTAPAVTIRSVPNRTDRLTILQTDASFTPIAMPANAFAANGASATFSAADVGRFAIGNIVFVISSAGATFGAITNINGNTISFATGDTLGLNQAALGGPLNFVTNAGTLATSVLRMQIIHYFIDSNGLLIRRVFGTAGTATGFRDSVIAEHVTDMQCRFGLNLFNANGSIQQPVTQLTTAAQQVAVRNVEVTLRVETTHGVINGTRPSVTMTTSTSVRNLQFRQALQPGAGG